MDKFFIKGGNQLKGSVEAQGSKNAVLPMMAASLLLSEGELVLNNVPNLADVQTMQDILYELGVYSSFTGNTLSLKVIDDSKNIARYDLVRKMRASFLVLGPLLGRRKKAVVSLPGGCIIGLRPVDLHVKGLLELGASIETKEGNIIAECRQLTGKTIYLGGRFGPTVTGTENVLMAAVLAEGITIIEYAACEPEVQDFCILLNKMGAHIEGIGSNRLVIHGVKELKGTTHNVIPDRIEVATFLMASAITNGMITVTNAAPQYLTCVLETLKNCNIQTVVTNDSITAFKKSERTLPAEIVTQPYPGFPTDLQAQIMTLLCYADGISVIIDNIFPDRFMHVAELLRMAADLKRSGNTVFIKGPIKLQSANVMASDLRASAALILATLSAEGESQISRIYHIDRGYERIEEKFQKLGANIERVKIPVESMAI
ncbi:MAG: UDP-N-acetylglucosamine 1-carboxyvinyltransferase [Planctomycetes bacterium]|nr:UDP-N-acetylglucosamine 1-carboxyvinyltransferase [Planctomycetota bacterium]